MDLFSTRKLNKPLKRYGLKQWFKHCGQLIRGNFKAQTEFSDSYPEVEDYENGFAAYYKKHIHPKVLMFEEERIASLRRARSRFIGLMGLGALALILVVIFYNYLAKMSDMLFFVLIAALFFGIAWVWQAIEHYHFAVKSVIYPKIFDFLGHYEYEPKGRMSLSALQDSDIIPYYQDEACEDYIKGQHKEVTLELTEAHLTKEVGSGKHRQTVTVFNGLAILLSAHKRFQGKTIITRDQGKVGNWFKDKLNRLNRVKLEDPRFEKIFEVYSSDQIEARYLLTTSFMQRLMDLSALFEGAGIEASFFNHHLLLLIPLPEDKNLFESHSIFEPADFKQDARTVLTEMKLIHKIIEVLKLDSRIRL